MLSPSHHQKIFVYATNWSCDVYAFVLDNMGRPFDPWLLVQWFFLHVGGSRLVRGLGLYEAYIRIYRNEVSDSLCKLAITAYIGIDYLIESIKRSVRVSSLVTSV